jgi:hypothetical protein
LVQLDVAFVGRSTWTAIIVDDFLELTQEVHLFRRSRGRVSVLDRMHVIPSMDMFSVFDDLVMIDDLWVPMFRVLVCAKRHPW